MSTRLSTRQNIDVDDLDCAAKGPHCGICQHVEFRDDWNRTMYCIIWQETTEIDVGSICSVFVPSSSVIPSSE